MFGPRWPLFRMFGIPIRADSSWLIIFALLTWTLATGLFPQALPEYSRGELWAWAW